jgi:hypothetical protein
MICDKYRGKNTGPQCVNKLYGFMVRPKDEILYETYTLPVLAYGADT